MNNKEAAKLLSLVKLAYPGAYREFNDEWKRATVQMWAMSFPNVPYPIMEQAFNRYRMESKFPPTVAELARELRRIHAGAESAALVQAQLGNDELCGRYRQLMEWTRPYAQNGTGPVSLGPGAAAPGIEEGRESNVQSQHR